MEEEDNFPRKGSGISWSSMYVATVYAKIIGADLALEEIPSEEIDKLLVKDRTRK